MRSFTYLKPENWEKFFALKDVSSECTRTSDEQLCQNEISVADDNYDGVERKWNKMCLRWPLQISQERKSTNDTETSCWCNVRWQVQSCLLRHFSKSPLIWLNWSKISLMKQVPKITHQLIKSSSLIRKKCTTKDHWWCAAGESVLRKAESVIKSKNQKSEKTTKQKSVLTW